MSPSSKAGVADDATPGARTSGFESSPPRDEKLKISSRSSRAPNSASPVSFGSMAATAVAREDAAGVPTELMPGPSLPAETLADSSG